MYRPSWDSTWMNVARLIAKRSTDPRSKVGSIIVTDDNTQVLSVGYNGGPAGGTNEPLSNEPGQSGFLHSELNSIIKCDFSHHKPKKMYVTMSPCRNCAVAIVNARISEVIYDEEYRDISGLTILNEAGVKVSKFRG